MIRFSSLACGAAIAGAIVSTAQAGDGNPPPWRGQPLSTTQGWNFVNGIQQGQSPNPAVAPFNNPYSFLPFTDHPIVYDFGGVTPLGEVGGVVIAPNGFIDFLIPNNIDPTTEKEIWVQIKFSGPIPQILAAGFNGNGGQITPLAFGQPQSGPNPIPGTNIFEMTFVMHLPVNPAGEIVEIFNNTAAPITIYQVVIDTICPTPGTAAAGLLGMGLMASRRRR